MADDISLVVGVDYSDLTGLVKTTQQTKQALGVMAQQFAKTGDQKAYMAGINKLVQANKMLDKESRMSRSAIMKLGNTMRQEAKFAEQLAKTTQRAGVAMQQTARKTNQLGVLMQQSGYQVGDFAIQVQSGTNYMVAFGQQATQLVGTFAMLAKSTRMIALFSGLGIALPILTAIGAYFIRAKDDAIDSAKGIEDAFSGLSGFFEDLSVSISDSFDDAFNNIEEKYGQLFTRLAKIKLDQTKASLTESFTSEIAPIESPSFIEKLGAALSPGMVMGSSSAALEAQGAVGKSTEEVYKLSKAIAEVEARYIASVNAAASLNDIIDITTKTEAELALISEEAANAFALQAEAAGITVKIQEQLNDSQEKSYKRFDAHTQAYQKHLDNIKEANSSAEESIRLEEQKLSLMLLEKDGVEAMGKYAETAARYERENLYLKLKQAGVSEDNIGRAIDLLAAQQQVTAEMIASADAAERLKNNLEIASSFRAGGDLGEFANVAGGLDAFGGAGSFKYGGSQKFKPEPDKKAQKSDLQKLREQLKLERALVGQTEARQKVIQALGVDFSKKNPETVASLEKQIQLTKELIQEEQQRKDLIGFVADSMGDSFMAMVDGTKSVKDAFREMASDIVRELYRVLVVQQMVNAAKSFMGFADGGAFSGGSQIQAYADGGVVGSPTYFGMSGGKTGLMGEDGPEAILPLKRGANGKLGVQVEGNGGGVTINQNINISTGVQQTVRTEIKSLMPQIAEQSKAAVLDAKRRGGSYGSKF